RCTGARSPCPPTPGTSPWKRCSRWPIRSGRPCCCHGSARLSSRCSSGQSRLGGAVTKRSPGPEGSNPIRSRHRQPITSPDHCHGRSTEPPAETGKSGCRGIGSSPCADDVVLHRAVTDRPCTCCRTPRAWLKYALVAQRHALPADSGFCVRLLCQGVCDMSARNQMLLQLTRLPFFLRLWNRFPFGSLRTRVDYGIFPYPHYAYGLFWAAILAAALDIGRISAIEFGVAGGRGLVALERVASEISRETGVAIDVFGFDSGAGMPAPVDYRDLPHIWGPGFYRMDVDKLRGKLSSAELVLGDVRDTTAAWIGQPHAPVGFVAFDLDYYSATVAALQIFSGTASTHLPRVHCYFDDDTTNDLGCMNPYVGELLAIRE